MVPNQGAAGANVQLVGSGYTPGDYLGTVRWDGADDGSFTIPDGGAFSIPYNIPDDATLGAHTITFCALNPCATGEFEQSASVVYTVTEVLTPTHAIYLPMIIKDGEDPEPEPFTYVVDDEVTPSMDELPGFDQTPRPLTAVQDPRGTVATFVANEVVLQTDDEAVLDDFLARNDGEILLKILPEEAGVSGLDNMYLVRVNLSLADTTNFTTNIESLMDSGIGSAGEYSFGDAAGVQIFSIAAEEAMSGLTVGINWVSDTSAIPVSSMEARKWPNNEQWRLRAGCVQLAPFCRGNHARHWCS